MGLGDEIMAAGRAESLYWEVGRPVAILDRDGARRKLHPVWEGNPVIDQSSDVTITDGPGARPYIDHWDGMRTVFNMDFRNSDHPGQIYVPEDLRRRAKDKIHHHTVIVEPVVQYPSSVNKRWPWYRWEQLIKSLPLVHFVQMAEDTARPIVKGAHRLITPTIWHAAAAIEQASMVVTVEGGTHHMAGAVGTAAVVLYGSFTHPQLTGYDTQVSLYVDDPGHSPCGNFELCASCQAMMAKIQVADVHAAIYDRAHNESWNPRPID
jgi:hypothetical protein